MNLADVLIKSSLADNRLYHKFEIPDSIYHYTTLNGLIAIIESQSLFSSNLHFLNDRKEYKYGVELILKIIKEFKQNKVHLNILNKIEENINLIYKSERYVTCFSRDGDLLSQWRAYGNNGKGVSIGFDRHNLGDGCFSQFLDEKIIVYDESDQIYSIKKQVNTILEYFENSKELIDSTEYDFDFLVAKVIIEFLEKSISTYKHPSFRDEKEYRIEYEIDGNINKKEEEELRFRASENLIVPYVKLTTKYLDYLKQKKDEEESVSPTFMIKRIPINNIIIGPSLEFSTLKESIEQLLIKNGYENVEILKSNVPYRI